MKQASAFSVINNRGSLRLQEPKWNRPLWQRLMPTDRKGLFTMLRRGERLFNCRQIFVNGGCGSASLGNGPDYQALAAAGVASRKIPGIEVI